MCKKVYLPATGAANAQIYQIAITCFGLLRVFWALKSYTLFSSERPRQQVTWLVYNLLGGGRCDLLEQRVYFPLAVSADCLQLTDRMFRQNIHTQTRTSMAKTLSMCVCTYIGEIWRHRWNLRCVCRGVSFSSSLIPNMYTFWSLHAPLVNLGDWCQNRPLSTTL